MKLERQMALLRAFLRQLPQERAQALCAYLPERDLEVMLAGPAYDCDPLRATPNMENLFDHIHPAWWIEKFEEMTSKDRTLIIAALPENQAKAVCAHFSITDPLPTIKPITRRFLYAHLYFMLTGGEFSILPPTCSGNHPLKELLFIPHDKLTALIDRLGLYDLSNELKKVIRSSHLKDIEEMLSTNELKFLSSIRKQHNQLVFGELGIKHWSGDTKELRRVLHKRGLNRLAKAFYGADEMLLWHLKHRLSPEDATLLDNLKVQVKDGRIFDILIGQMQATLETL